MLLLGAIHATHEQFGKTPSLHSEFKTDMDLERLPSGKFDTNLPGVSVRRCRDEPVATDWTKHPDEPTLDSIVSDIDVAQSLSSESPRSATGSAVIGR